MQAEAEELLREGRLAESLKKLQEQIRAKPADAELRVFLFQLLSVLGQWDRAMTQLNVAAELDAKCLLMAQVCRAALNCEALRTEIFKGNRTPVVFGEPAEWVGWMVRANGMIAQGQYAGAKELRQRAFEAAPTIPGSIDGNEFEWISDCDLRLGPILEAIIEGQYYWVPFSKIHQIEIETPADLRDVVWAPARFTWSNGGQAVGLIPGRYPGSQDSSDTAIQLARKTEWSEPDPGLYVGLGQRMFATDSNEYPLLTTARITLGPTETEEQAEDQKDG